MQPRMFVSHPEGRGCAVMSGRGLTCSGNKVNNITGPTFTGFTASLLTRPQTSSEQSLRLCFGHVGLLEVALETGAEAGVKSRQACLFHT